MAINVTTVPESQFQSVLLYDQPFCGVNASLTQMQQITPKWHCTLQGQRYPLYVLLKNRNAPDDLRMTLNLKCQKCPVYIKYLNVPRRSNFLSVWLYGQDTQLLKIGNATNDPKTNLENLRVKIPCIYKVPNSKAQLFVRFALWPAVFKIQLS